jgi:hypothetical protein
MVGLITINKSKIILLISLITFLFILVGFLLQSNLFEKQLITDNFNETCTTSIFQVENKSSFLIDYENINISQNLGNVKCLAKISWLQESDEFNKTKIYISTNYDLFKLLSSLNLFFVFLVLRIKEAKNIKFLVLSNFFLYNLLNQIIFRSDITFLDTFIFTSKYGLIWEFIFTTGTLSIILYAFGYNKSLKYLFLLNTIYALIPSITMLLLLVLAKENFKKS